MLLILLLTDPGKILSKSSKEHSNQDQGTNVVVFLHYFLVILGVSLSLSREYFRVNSPKRESAFSSSDICLPEVTVCRFNELIDCLLELVIGDHRV